MSREKKYASYNSLAPKKEQPVTPCMEVQNQQHRAQLLKESTIVCIDLWAQWCHPCTMISPDYARLAQEYNLSGKCMLIKENIDLKLTRDCEITGIPAFIFYRFGQLVKDKKDKPVMVTGGNLKQVRHILDELLSGR